MFQPDDIACSVFLTLLIEIRSCKTTIAAKSNKYRCLFNVSLAERGSVTYFNGQEYRVQAVKVESIIDTTGCGDSYHAGFVCSYMLENDIKKAMNVGSEIAAETLKHYGGF